MPRIKKQNDHNEGGRNIRQAFIEAGLELFGQCGLEGTSTRMLAQRAGANISGIAYYFGGKDKLYHEVVRHIAEHFSAFTREAVLEIRRELANSPGRAEILALAQDFFRAAAGLLADSGRLKYAINIILREQTNPTAAFDLLYENFIGERLRLLTELVGRYTGLSPASPQATIIAHSLVGQMLTFVVTRGALLKNLGRTELEAADLEMIQTVVAANVANCLESWAARPAGQGAGT